MPTEIPAAAIEAAAKAVFEVRDDPYNLDDWEDTDSTDRELFTCQARAALEAAAPHLTREARAAELEAAADDLTESGQVLAVISHDTGTDNAQTLHAITTDAEWLRARAAVIRAEGVN